jgi:hypothetical protein
VKSAAILAISLIALAGCSNRNVDSLEAVKQGVIHDLSKSKNFSMGNMDVNVVSVSFRDKEADAVVSFAPKGGTAAQGLTMKYTMERQGSEWHIKGRAQSDLQKHAAQAPPGAAPGVVGQDGGQQPLPPGHPPMNEGGSAPAAASGKQLPAGHPPLDK